MTLHTVRKNACQALEIVDPLHYPRWDELVLRTAGTSVFHSSPWARVLHDAYGYRPRYVVSVDGDHLDVLVPFMEIESIVTGKRGVSLPFTDYCDPIIKEGSEWDGVIGYLKNYAKINKWKYLELRGGEGLFDTNPDVISYYRHVMSLSRDVTGIYARLKSSIKRNIKKAEREGVTISRNNSLDAMKIFYRLHCITRKRHGVPPQPFNFFRCIYDHVIKAGRGNLFLAEYKGVPVAAAVYFHFGSEGIYKFGASDSRYFTLRPNDILMWEAIQWYCRNDFTKFSFGRTDCDNEGLRQFKKGWGAEEGVLKYYRYDVDKGVMSLETPSKSQFLTSVFRTMPISFSRIVGKLLYSHVG